MSNKITQSTNKTICKLFYGLFAYSLISLFAYSPVHAQSTIPLIVAPARQTILVDPGQTKSFSLRFYNTGVDPISGTFMVSDFIVDNNSGAPTFLDKTATLNSKYAAASWVTLNADRATLTGNNVVTVNGTIHVPANATPGGKYFAVFFEPTSNLPESTSTKKEEVSSVSVRLAGLVYLRVSGPISEGATVSKISVPGFSEYGPVTVTSVVRNLGDYHITPKGQVVIKDMFGRTVAGNDLAETNIFPGTSRTFTNELGVKWMIGRFTANLNATYGDSESMLSASTAFWVFPWKLALIILLGILIIVLITVLIAGKFVKKQKKLEQEIVEEKEEIEKLKEKYEDKTPPPAV